MLLAVVLRRFLRLRDGVEGQLDLLRSTRAIDGQRHGIARAVRLLRGVQVVHVADRRVADLGDDVTHLKASLFRGAARLDRADEHALRDIVAVLLRHLCGHVLRCDANVRLVGHIAVGHNVLDHGEHIVDGDGEADALNGGVGVARILRGHNADDLAVAVEERAAGVAGVDGAIDLDHVEGLAVHIDRAVHAGDDALRHREGQLAERVADRGDRLADLHAAGLSDHDRLEIRALDLDDGDVVILVAADDGGIIGRAVVGRDLDGARTLDDVIVGEDVAVLGDEKAAAAGGGLCRAAEDIRRGGHVDAHDAVDVGGVDLGHGELLLAVHLDLPDLGDLTVGDLDLRRAARGGKGVVRDARARRAADERAGERQRGDLQPQPILLRFLFLPGVCLCRGVRHLGVVHVADILHLVALAVAVMVQVVFVFVIHR